MNKNNTEQILLFQEILYKIKIDVNKTEILKEIEKLKKEDPKGVSYSNKGLGWQSNPTKTREVPYFSLLNKEISNIVSNMFNEQFITTRTHINVSPKYSYNGYHGHDGADLIGVFYVQVPEDSGNLAIWDPIQKHIGKVITPQPNYLYLFSSYLFHEVRMNMSDQERVSIAFNFNKNLNIEMVEKDINAYVKEMATLKEIHNKHENK